jgi:hypothetical protein
MPAFLFFLHFCLARDLFFSSASANGSLCNSPPGCNLSDLNNSLSFTDQLFLVDSELSGPSAQALLVFLNLSTSKNISVIGAPTVIDNTGLPVSEVPALYVENSSFSLTNITFKGFRSPILNGDGSKWSLVSVEFSNSEATVSPMLAFVNSEVKGTSVNLSGNVAHSQSLLAMMVCNVSFVDLRVTSTAMDSTDVRAAVHLLGSVMNVSGAVFSDNAMELPLIASSNESRFVLKSGRFVSNRVLSFTALEYDSSAEISNSIFENNRGTLSLGGQRSRFVFFGSSVTDHRSEEMLIGLSDSEVRINQSSFANSSIAGIVMTAGSNETPQYETILENSSFAHISATTPLIVTSGVRLSLSALRVRQVHSSSDIIVVSGQNGAISSLVNSKFSKISSSSPVATAIALMNCSDALVRNVTITRSAACAALYENTTVSVKDSTFSRNRCFPQGNSMPLAILSASLVNRFTLETTAFVNNTALTGSLFLMNVTGEVKDARFMHNEAVQGAGLFVLGSDLIVLRSQFTGNSAMTMGGAASLASSNTTFERCDFTGNSASEGAVISAKEMQRLTVLKSRVKRNNSTNATFLNVDAGETELKLEDVEVDDDIEKAVFLSHPSLANFSNSKFNCRLRCQTVGPVKQPKVVKKAMRKDEKRREPATRDEWEDELRPSTSRKIIWLVLPLPFGILVVVVLVSRSRRVRRFFRRLSLKGRHAL